MKKGIFTFAKILAGCCWLIVFAPAVSGRTYSASDKPIYSEKPTSVCTKQFNHGAPDWAPGAGPNGLISGPDTLCPGNIVDFCVPEVAGAIYHWNSTGDVDITDAANKSCTRIAAHLVCDGGFTLRVRIQTPVDDIIVEKTVVVQDKQAPAATCPPDITVSCDEQLPTPDPSAMKATDNCGGIKRDFVSGFVYDKICINRYKVTRTYKATDGCGNVTICTQRLEVRDGLDPYITCPPNLTVSCPDAALIPDAFYVIAADNCGYVAQKMHTGDKVTSLPQANRYQITRTYQAEDNCGNTQTCTQKLEVLDSEPPKITCPASFTVSCASQVPAASPGNAQVSDNCGTVFLNTTVTDDISNQTCASQYQLIRTFRVTDAAGHTASCSQKYVVNDPTPPAITCPPNTTLSCGDEALEVDLTKVVVSDNCGSYTKSLVKDEITNKICDNNFTLTRSFRVEDDCGRSATCSVKIRVQNQPASTAIVCPPNITVSCPSEVPASNPASSSVSDYCGNILNTVSWLGDLVTGKTCDNRYLISRTYRATDACGVTGNCIQKITVNDQTPPTLVCPDNITVSCAAQVPLAAPGDVSVSDNCSGGKLNIYVGDAIGNNACQNRYLITRTYRSKDVCGNEGTCVRMITVDDQAAPVIKCPNNITVACASLVPPANPTLITGTDNCAGSFTKQFAGDVISDQTCSSRYLLTRTYQGTDLCGNVGACTQQITVSDQKAPTTITCPANITVSDESKIPAANIAGVAASGENCGGVILKGHVEDIISDRACEGNYLLNRIYSAADDCGNSKTCQQKITVSGCFCTHPQEFWGDPDGKTDQLTTAQVIDSLLRQGALSIGDTSGCGLTVATTDCILQLLPADGPSVPFDAAGLPVCDEVLENTLAGQLIALQLNIRFNASFRGMNLGALPLADVCSFDAAQLATLGLPPGAAVQDLVATANNYLAGKCHDISFPDNYGDHLAAGIAILHEYWNHCQNNETCKPGNFSPDGIAERDADDEKQAFTGEIFLRPNPVSHLLQTTFTVAEAEKTQLQVFNREGRLVFSHEVVSVAGANTIEIDVAGWNPGLYWFVLATNRSVETKRFVVLR